ncbi:MAG: DUF2326 domain-containing protein [Treponema sp.]|jgi:uncharacterized protein YydD (DUF2326 family)|nr:DUF2326 domain-containing protein [Treponema sp.]
MRLIRVFANKESFHTVVFNQAGLSFIAAKQKKPGMNDDGKTYNGVGKSLLVRIINFCLGADARNYTSFCEKLADWEFGLDFKVNMRNFTVRRSIAESKKIFLNDEEYSLDKYTSIMKELCFLIPEDMGSLSFRTLIPFFLRPDKGSYDNCMNPGKTHTDYQTQINNALLIGLDVKLAERKYILRKEQTRLDDLEKNFKKDDLLRDYFSGNKDISLALADIDDQIKKLENDLASFQVAEDYHDIQAEADEIKTDLFNLNNEIVIIQQNLKNIENSLQGMAASSVTSSDIEKIYNESNIFFPELVKKTLGDVEAFYESLISSRVRRLSEQKNQMLISLNEKSRRQAELQKQFNEKMKYLGSYQAIDVFISLGQRSAALKAQKDNLTRYQELQFEYKSRERETKKELLDLVEITENYLNEIDAATQKIKEYFRALVKLFYPNSVAGLKISANEGENQIAFKIEPRIESDASDGINKVKIFCYDLSILLEGKNHSVDFIFHDSRLYDGIDDRQKTAMFTILRDVFLNSKKQYIATINQNQLTEIMANLSADDYKTIIEDNIVLTLTDDDDSEKLLGIKVDIGSK